MPDSVTQAFVQQFSANIYNLAQQKGSRLRAFSQQKMVTGDSAYFERLGTATAQEKSGRHSDMPLLEAAHTRRKVSMTDFEWATLLDTEDQLKMLIDPVSGYSQAAMWALGRSLDDVLVAAMGGNAYSGPAGATSVPLTASQYIGAVSGGALSNMNIETLRAVKEIFDSNDVDESIPRHIAITSSQLRSLLGQTEVTNHDYASVKALVQGTIDSFLGFQFHRLERLPTNANPFRSSSSFAATVDVSSGAVTLSTGNGDALRRCFAWAEDGIGLAIGSDIKGSVDRRVDKSGIPWQVSASMSIGATRIEEAKVVGILCSES